MYEVNDLVSVFIILETPQYDILPLDQLRIVGNMHSGQQCTMDLQKVCVHIPYMSRGVI